MMSYLGICSSIYLCGYIAVLVGCRISAGNWDGICEFIVIAAFWPIMVIIFALDEAWIRTIAWKRMRS